GKDDDAYEAEFEVEIRAAPRIEQHGEQIAVNPEQARQTQKLEGQNSVSPLVAQHHDDAIFRHERHADHYGHTKESNQHQQADKPVMQAGQVVLQAAKCRIGDLINVGGEFFGRQRGQLKCQCIKAQNLGPSEPADKCVIDIGVQVPQQGPQTDVNPESQQA